MAKGIRNVSFVTGMDRVTEKNHNFGAVIVQKAVKCYTTGVNILDGLDMTVPCGSIYGLLGSSGCGKTTLLSCIVGLRTLDSGNIYVFGGKPGTRISGVPGRNVGYMPQDVSLLSEFSIKETLNYFGLLVGMSSDEIGKRSHFLCDLMGLKDNTRRIGTFSGGQQRRVSLAVALINLPKLLILDEPTVGLDSLIQQRIWDHLKLLTEQNGITVILTTHYIEECRRADYIGIMRNKKIVKETSVASLLAESGNDLEQIVLKLSRTDEGNSFEEEPDRNILVGRADIKMASITNKQDTMHDSIARIRALAVKNFTILWRVPILVLVAIYTVFGGIVLLNYSHGGEPTDLPFGVVNPDLKFFSEESCPIEMVTGCSGELLSCRFLDKIMQGDLLALKSYPNEYSAIKAVENGNSWGYMKFPSNFSFSLFDRFSSGVQVDEFTLETSRITVHLDESNKVISLLTKLFLWKTFQKFVKGFLVECQQDERLGDFPIKPLFSEGEVNFKVFLGPGCCLTLLYFSSSLITSFRLINEKELGVTQRSVVSGVKMWEVLAGCFLADVLIIILQSITNYLGLLYIFKLEILGSHLLFVGLITLTGIGGIALGCFMGSACDSGMQAAVIAMAIFFPGIILSGSMWPIEGMVESLQFIVQFLPCTLAAESARSIASRGWKFTHPHVWPGIAVLSGYTIGLSLLTLFVVSLKHKKC